MADLSPQLRAADPLDQAMASVLRADCVRARFPSGLAIRLGPAPAVPPTAAESGGGAVLHWDLSRQRARIGPLIDGSSAGCGLCLSAWIEHNRPDRALWAQVTELSGADAPVETLPWPGFAFALLEQATLEFLADGDPRGYVDVAYLPGRIERHRYQPAPDCPVCTPRRADTPGLAPAPSGPTPKAAPNIFRSRAEAPDVARLRADFVDYRTGLIRHMYRDASSTMLPMWAAETNVAGSDLIEAGYGRTANPRSAEAIAILEALERFCGQAPRARTGFRRASYAALQAAGVPAVDPESFILPSEAQRATPSYALAAYAPDRAYDWIWAYSFRRRAPMLIPLQFGFYDQRMMPQEERFVIESSNGCALGGSPVEASFHALLELIERDAYMTRWHVKGAPRRIDIAGGVSPSVRDLHARVSAEGFELHAFDITLEIPIPTVLAMIVDPSESAPVKSYCASAAHPVAASAVNSALVEVVSSIAVYQGQFGSERDRARVLFADGDAVTGMRDHVLLYSLPETMERLAFLDRRRPAEPAASLFDAIESRWRGADLAEDLNQAIDHVLAIADDVILVDQTADIVRHHGLHCVKLLAPGLHPVTFGHQYRRISDARLARARAHLASKGEAYAEGHNPFPHNFP